MELNKGWASGDAKFQIGVVVVDTLDGRDINEFANDNARKWKIGYGDTNNGALFVLAVKDRETRIETSDKVATVVTDSHASQILDDAGDFFRDKKWDKGTLHVVKTVGSGFESGGETLPETSSAGGLVLIIIFVGFMGLVFIASLLSGESFWYVLASILLSSSSSSTSSHSSSSSFSGGRSGGGFGGGGARGGF